MCVVVLSELSDWAGTPRFAGVDALACSSTMKKENWTEVARLCLMHVIIALSF